MQYISLFLDITKFDDLRWKNADVSRTQGGCHMIHKFFESLLGKVQLCNLFLNILQYSQACNFMFKNKLFKNTYFEK